MARRPEPRRPGRALHDQVQAMLRFNGGARGMLRASQVASGACNALCLRVYGTRASLHFDQEQPEFLNFAPLGGPVRQLRRGMAPQTNASRIPAGHPEGYFEAFAELYRDFARAWRGGDSPNMPGLPDGLDGIAFFGAVLSSHNQNARWVRLGV